MLCCQEQETIDHITLQCSFAREVWFYVLSKHGLQRFTPEDDEDIAIWWPRVSGAVAKQNKKELNSLVILVAWELWLQRNAGVFDRNSSPPAVVCLRINESFQLWRKAWRSTGGVGRQIT